MVGFRQEEALGYSISICSTKIGEDQKKTLHVRRCRVFSTNIGEDKKKGLCCS